MKAGRASIGFDDRPVNLHHMLQIKDGPLVEVSSSHSIKNILPLLALILTQKNQLLIETNLRW